MIVDGKVVASYEGLNHPQKNKLPKSQFPTLGEFFVIALNFTKLQHLTVSLTGCFPANGTTARKRPYKG